MARTTTTKRKNSSGKKPPVKTKTLKNEILAVILFAVALVLFLGIVGVGGESGVGKVGEFLTTIMRALAGKGAIIFPFFVLFWGIVALVNRHGRPWNGKITGLLILAVSVISLLHVDVPTATFRLHMADALGGAGGGIIGGFVLYLLKAAFGQWGSVVILIATSVIGLLLLIQVSLWEALKTLFNWVKSRISGIERNRKPKEPKQKEPKPAKVKEIPENPIVERVSTPLIINHEDRGQIPQTPVVDEVIPEEEKPGLAPPENRFSQKFMPAITPSLQNEDEPPAIAEDNNELPPIWDSSLHENEKLPAQEADYPPTDAEPPVPDVAPFVDEVLMSDKFSGDEDNEPNLENIEEKLAARAAAKKAALAAAEQAQANPGFPPPPPAPYKLPTPDLLPATVKIKNPRMNKEITDAVVIIESTLSNFGVKAKVVQVVAGPAVTRYELQPAPGVKVSKITGLIDDLALSLAAQEIRIEAPIPGKSAVGIEVPRSEVSMVHFRDLIESEAFQKSQSKITFVLGKDISGDCIVGDLSKMPHLLIAGSTGSGKSVCLNSIICSILYKAKPDEVKLMLIDPKRVELTLYSHLPHLITPVVTDSKKAAGCLKWAVKEMEDRYSLFAANQAKNYKGYNDAHPENPLPQIVIVIDELADLMLVAPADVEESICRLAQMARAAGMHLIVATQRPSVDVITGLIKANIPSRIAFAVSSAIDSRTILDASGADKLLGNGDMLYHPVGIPKPIRIQGTFIAEKDIATLADFAHKQSPLLQFQAEEAIESAASTLGQKKSNGNGSNNEGDYGDILFHDAARLLIETGQASTSFLQRRLRIGNPRAARIMDILEENGIVGPPDGAKPRNILISLDQFNEQF